MTNTLDINGMPIRAGDTVILVGLPRFLTDDLPAEDARAINERVGSTHEVVGFNDIGWAELEFTDDNGDFRTIWVEGTHLRRTGP